MAKIKLLPIEGKHEDSSDLFFWDDVLKDEGPESIRDFGEKGTGRGWWAPPKGTHVGRTKRTEAGGAKLTFTGPPLSDAAKAGIIEQYESIPGWARSVVSEVEMVNGPGDVFEAGGQQFRTGAEWHHTTGKIRLYNAEQLGLQPDHTKDLLVHEIGHGLGNAWWGKAFGQGLNAMSEHPGWFDRSGYVKLEFTEPYMKKYPLAAARDLFNQAWDAGEDGITSYSKAWASSGNSSETVAEMTKLYLTTSPAVFNTYMGREKAPNLGRAYLDAVAYFEGQGT